MSIALPFSLIPFSIFFLKFFAMAGTLISILGLISFRQMGTFLKVSMGVFPVFTEAMLAPLPINANIPPVWPKE